jgi:hypothetical protein
MTHITKQMKQLIQQLLNTHFDFNLAEDGVIGKQSLYRIKSVVDHDWPKDRQIIGVLQLLASLEDIEAGKVDGLWGHQTEYAYEQLQYKQQHGHIEIWRDDDIGENIENNPWPPQNEQDMFAFYGAVGTNQTKAVSPYPLRLAWATDTIITRFSCHTKVKDSIERVLQKVLDHYGLDQITELGLDMWGGCLNVRQMRGGTKWSTHSWGSAIDWDPVRNQLKWKKDKANFVKAEYDFWWQCWEDEGWVSLGRSKDFDWMHIQASTL